MNCNSTILATIARYEAALHANRHKSLLKPINCNLVNFGEFYKYLMSTANFIRISFERLDTNSNGEPFLSWKLTVASNIPKCIMELKQPSLGHIKRLITSFMLCKISMKVFYGTVELYCFCLFSLQYAKKSSNFARVWLQICLALSFQGTWLVKTRQNWHMCGQWNSRKGVTQRNTLVPPSTSHGMTPVYGVAATSFMKTFLNFSNLSFSTNQRKLLKEYILIQKVISIPGLGSNIKVGGGELKYDEKIFPKKLMFPLEVYLKIVSIIWIPFATV